jgi:hypothetical protein
VTTYWDGSFNQVQVWVVSGYGHLYAHYYNQSGWHTDDHGNGNGVFLQGPAVTTYWDGSFNQLQVWATGFDGHLYAHYYNQTGWHTDDHGDGNGVALYGGPAVTTYWDGSFNQVHVWAMGWDGHLYAHYYNQSGWHTDDHGVGGDGYGPAGNAFGFGGGGLTSGGATEPARPAQNALVPPSVFTKQKPEDLVFAAPTAEDSFPEPSGLLSPAALDLLAGNLVEKV